MTFNDFTYGLFGGLSGTLISHPFDTIKTRIQTNKASTIGQAVKIGKLYSGITPPLVGIMLEKSIVFGFYEKSKSMGLNNFWSGIIGGFISTIVVTPVDRLKINYQNQELKMNNLETIKKVLAPKNLYKGFTPTIFRETPGFGIYFSTYNYLTDRFNKFNNIGTTFCFGALSGLSAWLFIYPSDLIKTKYQAVNNKTSLPNTIKNIWILNNPNNNIFRGMRNFYSGFNLAILRAMPLHGGVFLGYELSKKILVN
jgi:solute carrier family 25 carnitine/acylcarnitine transporter 20/29